MDKHKVKDVNPRDKRKSGKIKNAYNFKNLQTEIRGYGYEYKFGKFFLQLLIVFLAIIVAGLLYKLNTTCIVVLCIIALVLFPVIIAAQFRYIYEQKKFTMLVEYLEHMIFNFKKTPKILVALRDTRELVSVEMQSLIDHAIEVIENREDATNLYQEAFAEFEKQFPCSRLLALHRFLINIELQGGNYQSAIDLLLVDIRAWVERTYIYQKELKNIKNKIVEYNMNDLSTAMKMLYTLQSLGSEDSEKQLHVLIERNQGMLEKSERIRNEDMLGSIGFIVALPMLLASLKLVADLGMILMSFFSFGGLGVS